MDTVNVDDKYHELLIFNDNLKAFSKSKTEFTNLHLLLKYCNIGINYQLKKYA